MNDDQSKSDQDVANAESSTDTPVAEVESKANGNGAQSEDSSSPQPVVVPDDYEPVEVKLKTLLDAGAHFGHKVEKWNPKMMRYIYGERNGLHIINLDYTLSLWEKARKFVVDVTSRGGNVLFVGTKMQAQEVIKESAERCGAFYINSRWLGGTLSNFQTMKNSIRRMRNLEDLVRQAEDENSDVRITKKEQLSIRRQVEKLSTNLGGIREMRRLPDLIFIIDIQKESIAVAEARKLHLPVVALTDSNVDPNLVSFPIPSNDDATRTIRLFANAVADAVIEGKLAYNQRVEAKALAGEKGDSTPAADSSTVSEMNQSGVVSVG